MRIVYIAGPYNSPNKFIIVSNILQAAAASAEIWGNGGVAICPHLNTALFDYFLPSLTNEEYVVGDLEILRRCDAILMVGNWEASAGAKKEIALAKRLGLPVFLNTVEAVGWVQEKKKSGLDK